MFRLGVVIVLVSMWRGAHVQDTDAPNSKFMWARPRYVMPWLKGPNVCAVEEVEGTRKQYYSDCMPILPRNVCQKSTYIRFHCCTGYERTEGKPGCSGVKPIFDLMETAKHLYLRDLRENVKQAGQEEHFKTDGPYTIFAPHNDAFAELTDAQREELATQDESRSLLRLHVVEGRHDMADIRNGDTLTSRYYSQDKGQLKVNRYTNGITTVNCARIILPDQGASNGVIHVVEEVLEPHSTDDTLMDILLEDDRFGEFVTALITTDVGNEVRDKSKSITVFAPTDEAFRNTSPDIIERILKDKELVRKMLRYHIIDESLCTAAIIGNYSYVSREGQKVNLSCDVNDRIVVNGHRLKSEVDIVGSNGVIHAIDNVLIPDSVKTLDDVMLDLDLGQFIEYAQGAGYSDILTADTPGNYTVFAPTGAAFDSLDRGMKRRIQTDSSLLRKVISYHIVPGAVGTREMTDGMSLNTLGDTPLRVTLYQEDLGVGSAKILSSDHPSGHGVVHVVDRILFPPEESALQKILLDPRLTTLYTMIEKVGLLDTFEGSGHMSIFAPTNEAFGALGPDVLQTILNSPHELEKMLNFHIINKPVFTNYLRPDLQYRYKTLAEEYVHLEKTKTGNKDVVVEGSVKIINGDIESTTGVVHVVDSVLKCPCVDAFRASVEPSRNQMFRRGDTRRRFKYRL